MKNMELNIKDEDVYLDQFKQLLQLKDYIKTGHEPFLIQQRISGTVYYTVGKQDFATNNQPTFVCKREERVLKRQKLFHDNMLNLNVQNSYDTCLNLLIDLEESFTM